MWKPFVKDDAVLSAKEPYHFFMVRRHGIHPSFGTKFVPFVVQLIDGELYSSDNELEPIKLVKAIGPYAPTTNPFEADLEWCEIPE